MKLSNENQDDCSGSVTSLSSIRMVFVCTLRLQLNIISMKESIMETIRRDLVF